MNPKSRQAALLKAARRVFDAEALRDQLQEDLERAEAELQAAQKAHLLLTEGGAETAPKKKRQRRPHGESARQLVLQYVAQHAPVDQKKIVADIMSEHDLGIGTVNQAVYDLTSSKTGWLMRDSDGISLTDKGRAQLKASHVTGGPS